MNFKDQIEHLKTFFTPSVKNVILLIRWLITAVFTGLLVGAVGTLFYYAMSFVTGCRTAHPILICRSADYFSLQGKRSVQQYRNQSGSVLHPVGQPYFC